MSLIKPGAQVQSSFVLVCFFINPPRHEGKFAYILVGKLESALPWLLLLSGALIEPHSTTLIPGRWGLSLWTSGLLLPREKYGAVGHSLERP